MGIDTSAVRHLKRMVEKCQCWVCKSQSGPFYIKGYGTENEFKLCGSCIGIMAAVESRLFTISRCGKLDDYFTAKGENVPSCEKDLIEDENEDY